MEIKHDQERLALFSDLALLKNKVLLNFNPYDEKDNKIFDTVNEIYWRFELLYFIIEYAEMSEEEQTVFWEESNDDIDITSNSIEIRLSIITKDIDEKKLLVDAINNMKMLKTTKKLFNEIQKLHNDLVNETQSYLKTEWDRIKKESLGKFRRNKNYEKNKNQHNAFFDYTNNKLLKYIKENFG